jgi:hypothetical protein
VCVCVCVCVYNVGYYSIRCWASGSIGKGETVVEKVGARVVSHGVVCKELSSLEEVWCYEVLQFCYVG